MVLSRKEELAIIALGQWKGTNSSVSSLAEDKAIFNIASQVIRKRSPRPIDVFSLGRLTLFGMVRLCARQGVPGELISEGVATA